MPPTSPNLKKLHLPLMNWNLVVDELATNATGTWSTHAMLLKDSTFSGVLPVSADFVFSTVVFWGVKLKTWHSHKKMNNLGDNLLNPFLRPVYLRILQPIHNPHAKMLPTSSKTHLWFFSETKHSWKVCLGWFWGKLCFVQVYHSVDDNPPSP